MPSESLCAEFIVCGQLWDLTDSIPCQRAGGCQAPAEKQHFRHVSWMLLHLPTFWMHKNNCTPRRAESLHHCWLLRFLRAAGKAMQIISSFILHFCTSPQTHSFSTRRLLWLTLTLTLWLRRNPFESWRGLLEWILSPTNLNRLNMLLKMYITVFLWVKIPIWETFLIKF